MKVEQYYEGNNLFITKATWDQLLQSKESVAFHGVVIAAKETIQRDGAFIIYCDVTTDIQRRCDRMSDLNEEIA